MRQPAQPITRAAWSSFRVQPEPFTKVKGFAPIMAFPESGSPQIISLAVTSVSLDRRKLSPSAPSSATTGGGVCLRDHGATKEKAPAEDWGALKLAG
jgi:hypothetical protein